MSTNLKLLLAIIASSTLLLGCTTPHRTGHWEYKTVIVPSYTQDANDAKLNRLADEGWEVISFARNDGGSNESTFILKRRK